MVMNSFEKRNFMQPMGRPKDVLKVPYIFSLAAPPPAPPPPRCFFIFPCFPMCFHYVPSKFQWVPMRFSIYSPSSKCHPKHGFHSMSLLSRMFWQMLSCFHLYSYYPCSYKLKTCIIITEIKRSMSSIPFQDHLRWACDLFISIYSNFHPIFRTTINERSKLFLKEHLNERAQAFIFQHHVSIVF